MNTTRHLTLLATAWVLTVLSIHPVHALLPGGDFDPFAKTSSVSPGVSFSENVSEKTITSPMPDVTGTGKLSCTITAAMPPSPDFDLASIDETTSITVTIGAFTFSGSLSNDSKYVAGKTSATLPITGGAGGPPSTTDTVALSWSKSKLTITVSHPLTGSGPGMYSGTAAVTNYFMQPNPAIRTTLNVSFSFASVSGQRMVYYTGKSSQTSSIVGVPPMDVTLTTHSVSLSGSAEYSAPTITLIGPKSGTQVDTTATIMGSLTEEHSMALIGGLPGSSSSGGVKALVLPFSVTSPWTINVSDWSGAPLPIATVKWEATANDPDLEWGAMTGSWSAALSGVGWGTNYVHIWADDASGNHSKLLVVQLVRQLPRLFQGRWDAISHDATFGQGSYFDFQGGGSVTIAANGSYTGKLTTKGISVSWKGNVTLDGQVGVVFQLFPSLEIYEVSMQLPLPDTMGVGGGTGPGGSSQLSGTIQQLDLASLDPIGQRGTITGVHSPWSSSQLAPTTLAGSFHIGIDKHDMSPVLGGSYLTLTTTRAGAASASGRMADGTAITWSGIIGGDPPSSGTLGMPPTASCPMFVRLYGGQGSIASMWTINGSSSIMPTPSSVAGNLEWTRFPGNSDKQFPDGFELTLTSDGEVYTPPPSGTRILGLDTLAPTFDLNASGDGLSSPVGVTITVSDKNALSIATNTLGLSLSIATSSGLVTGNLNVSDPTAAKASINGLLVGNQIVGHYIAPAPTGSSLKRYGLVTASGGGGMP